MTKAKIHKLLMTLLITVCIFAATVVSGWSLNIPTAYAESDDVQTRYEQTNVMNNLKGSTIGGKAFDVKDYPHSSTGKPQIISFVEFCYSYYADKQSDYGLYVYVYNPQDTAIDTNTQRNKIQFTYGNKAGYSKYVLQFLNYSTETGYEGRFYKFKIVLSNAERNDILKTLSADERVYKVSGIELSVKNNVTEHACVQQYTYKGYALGYGSELAESDTLSCVVDGFDKYLSLDVRSTFWRPKGTHADRATRDTLHSVYFSVPNKIIDEFGEMTAVHATWLNAYTAPIFVTGNKSIYNAFEPYVGQYVNGGHQKANDANTSLKYTLVADARGDPKLAADYIPDDAYYAYNAYIGLTTSGKDSDFSSAYGKFLYYLHYLFYADNGNADTYTLPAEKIIGDKTKDIDGWLKTYSDKHGGKLINDRFSEALFEKVDAKFTDVNIRSTDTYKLQDKILSTSFWDALFHGDVQGTNDYEMQAIQKVTVKDFNDNNKDIFCDKFYVDANDYDSMRDYVTDASAKQETVYLFRYYQSEYISREVSELERTTNGSVKCYKFLDTNAYMAQMWVQLDFDIIDLTFTKDNVVTKIPVVMSPMDIAADADHPVYTTDDNKGLSWWQIILAILLGILIIILLLKFAPNILFVLIKILFLPFKLIGAVFKGISSATKAMRERRKQAKAERKEQKRIEREQRKEQERQRREAEKQKRRDEKRERQERERERKRDEKEKERERKRGEKGRKQQDKDFERWRKKSEKQTRKRLKNTDRTKLTLADLDGMSDAELAELYFEEYGDEELYNPFEDDDYPL